MINWCHEEKRFIQNYNLTPHMPNEGGGIAIGVLAIVVIVLLYFAVVGHLVISYYVYFSFWNRVGFGFLALVIIIGLFFLAKES